MLLSLFTVIISIHLQWSSSHEERTKIIQEGLLNPSADILEAMTETGAMHTGKIFLPKFFIFCNSVTRIILIQYIFIQMFLFFLILYLASKPTESLEQITAFDM